MRRRKHVVRTGAIACIVSMGALLPPAARGAGSERAAACIRAAHEGQGERDAGRMRRARELFVQCAGAGCPGEVSDYCAKWLREVSESGPTVVFAARDPLGEDRADARVFMDGAPVADRTDGRPVLMDLGEHVFRFEHAEWAAVEVRAVVRASDRNRLVEVQFVRTGSARGAAPSAAASVPLPAGSPGPESPGSARPWVTLSLLAGSIASAGLGVYFFAAATDAADVAAGYRRDNRPDACAGVVSADCERWGRAVDDQARNAVASRVAFGVSGALAAGAVVAWLAWPRPRDPAAGARVRFSPVVSPGIVMAGAEGRF